MVDQETSRPVPVPVDLAAEEAEVSAAEVGLSIEDERLCARELRFGQWQDYLARLAGRVRDRGADPDRSGPLDEVAATLERSRQRSALVAAEREVLLTVRRELLARRRKRLSARQAELDRIEVEFARVESELLDFVGAHAVAGAEPADSPAAELDASKSSGRRAASTPAIAPVMVGTVSTASPTRTRSTARIVVDRTGRDSGSWSTRLSDTVSLMPDTVVSQADEISLPSSMADRPRGAARRKLHSTNPFMAILTLAGETVTRQQIEFDRVGRRLRIRLSLASADPLAFTALSWRTREGEPHEVSVEVIGIDTIEGEKEIEVTLALAHWQREQLDAFDRLLEQVP